MIVVRGTKKFLDRVGRPDTSYESSTSLDRELAGMAEHVLAKTASRSVLGVMNEFAHMADQYRTGRGSLDRRCGTGYE
jgi:hypothetical protein